MKQINSGFHLQVMLTVMIILLLMPVDTQAYERYNDGCQDCHGEFTDSTSPKGSIIVPNKHDMHRAGSAMATDCDLCHTTGDGRNPYLGSSNGTSNNPGLGCSGCHGRDVDMGLDDISSGRGAGLRQHHWTAGETICGDCHTDVDPSMNTLMGEFVVPTYYGTADTNVDQPCNDVAQANLNENWTISDFIGLDTDGDHNYDGDDPDCQDAPGGTVSCSFGATPATGTLPFTAAFSGALTNNYAGQIRRVAARIDITLANGTGFPSWRAGYTNIDAAGSFGIAFGVTLPALGSLVGSNVFELVAVDVTPSPFNQPPYPPAGDTCSGLATVVGHP